jgi:2-succinyl-5-enolpyruvyl-6-hydroxy-3-cyclohexene-1-carboxylate synthase
MLHPKQHIVDLVELCKLKKLEHVILSPGSRNAELIRLFTSIPGFQTKSIVDERSAGYFAIGIARFTGHPVILACTSGTAVLNYAPAIAEASYQRIPLIVITADRPPELIDQQDNQTIRQENIYKNYIKESLSLPLNCSSGDQLEEVHFLVNRIINLASEHCKGPVHINVPLAEPLYGKLPAPSPIINQTGMEVLLQDKIPDRFRETWVSAKKRMIVCGEQVYDRNLNEVLNEIANKSLAVVLAEPISNIKGKNIISAVDRVMMIVEDEDNNTFSPDILLSTGGQVVSKRLKLWLRKIKVTEHWRLSEDGDNIDTYQNLTGTVKGIPSELFYELLNKETESGNEYPAEWHSVNKDTGELSNDYLDKAPYSDIRVIHHMVKALPEKCYLHLGNSSPVRYAQLFDLGRCLQVHSNRGVSGIDGCLSTASGFASVSGGMNILIIGDLSFVYDSNALWNRQLSPGLRVVVINNQGGGIFRLIRGPSDFKGFEEYQEAYHPADIRKLSEAFNISYYYCDKAENLFLVFKEFINSGDKPSILEIKTPKNKNPVIYQEYINNLKSRYEQEQRMADH